MKKNSWTQFFNHKVSKIDVKNTVPLRKCTHICTLMSHHNNNRIGIDESVVKVHTKCSMKECIEVKKSNQGYFKMGHH